MPRPARPLVGREAELVEVATALGLDDAAAATCHAAVVGGDAGIGKTRVVAELRRRAEDAGWRVALGRCLDLGDDVAAWLPVSEAVSGLDASEPGLLDAPIARHPGAAALVPGRVPAGRGAGEPRSLLEATAGLLGDLAADRPLLLVVEDVHWADPSTRSLLGLLLAREPTTPLRVVVTYRSDDLHRRHPLRPVLAGWSRLAGVLRLGLGPLPPTDVAAMARELAGPAVDDAALATVVARADGNAFFVEELVAALAGTGPGHRAAGVLPEDLADLLLVRLEGLDDPTRTLVRAVAAAGAGVGEDLLGLVTGLGAPDLEAALRQAVERHVLVAEPDGPVFRHALLAEATYGDLLPGERTRLHGRFARALAAADTVAGPSGGRAAALARHARLAGEREIAVLASAAAGDEAMRVSGPGEAAGHYERALELLAAGARPDPASGLEQVGLVVRAARALVDAGTVERAAALVRDALAGDVVAHDEVRLELALLQAALVGDVEVDVHVLARDLRGRADGLDDELRADVLAAFALALRVTDAPAALAAAQEARRLAERQGRSGLVADLRLTEARIEASEPGAGRRVMRQVVEQARREGDVLAELRGGYHLATSQLEAGEADAAADAFAAVVRRADEANRTWAPYGLDARIVGVMAGYVAGRWDEALALADTGPGVVPPVPRALLLAAALHVHAARGSQGHADELEEVRARWDQDTYLGLLAGAAGAELLAGSGDLAGAVRLHDEALEVVERGWGAGAPARLRLGALLLGHLAGAAGRRGRAEVDGVDLAATGDRVLTGLRAVAAGEGGLPLGPEGRTWAARAEAEALRLARVLGRDVDVDALVDAWTGTVAGFDALEHVWEAARSRARLAAALHAAGRSGEAQAAAAAAAGVARRLGAAPLLHELGAPAATDEGSGGLTSREHEVLRLVAAGLSNGEVGQRLFISTKTVSVHVSRILAKLGAAGRTEAAAVARRRGLLDD